MWSTLHKYLMLKYDLITSIRQSIFRDTRMGDSLPLPNAHLCNNRWHVCFFNHCVKIVNGISGALFYRQVFSIA